MRLFGEAPGDHRSGSPGAAHDEIVGRPEIGAASCLIFARATMHFPGFAGEEGNCHVLGLSLVGARAGSVRRTRNLANARQVVIALAKEGDALRFRTGCLGDTLLEASGQTPAALAKLNDEINALRNPAYWHIGGWVVAETPAEAD
ncbi:hypothetical protein [Novosphingobium gossypii]|uniref:hypothetical protein n=1 Tax=Novosphingobium gossypii TaxID=1604774 RepID=UPI003D1B57F4